MDIAYLTCLFLAATQFIGYCTYIAAICDHFDLMMQNVQANVEQNLRETNQQKFEETSMKIIAKVREAVQIHVKINE